MNPHSTAFVAAYLECALWSSTHTEREDGDPVPCDSLNHDWSMEAQTRAEADCLAFTTANASDLEDMEPEQAGHDYWLTRNGHGAGFWDRGLGERGERLSQACRHDSCDVYLGDDNRWHLS